MLLAALFCAMATAVEIYTVSTLLKTNEAVNWPTTKGVIVRSELSAERVIKTSYEAHIEYTYQVGGKPFKSKQVRSRGAGSKYRNEVAPLVDQFPVGKETQVFYNPTNPADALLVVGADLSDYLIVIFPVFFMGAAGFAVVALFLQWRKNAREGYEPHEDEFENEPEGYRTLGPDVRFHCPVCKTEVAARTFRLFEVHAVPQEETFVECIPCGITRLVHLPLEELDQYSVDELTEHLTPRVSIVVKFLAIASVVLFLVPFVGLVLGGVGLLASYHSGSWTKRVSLIGVGLSSVVAIVFVCMLIWA